MKKNKFPTTLKGWMNLIYKQSLPILVHTGKSLVPQMLNPNISLKQMGLLIEQDPILSFYVFKEAKRANNENNTEIKSISHALSLIGLETAQNLIRRLPVLSPKENPFRAYYYLTSISNSLHAACQARYWAETKHHFAKNDLFWACLFSNIAYWCLWYIAYEKMQQIDELIRIGQSSRTTAEKHILGCTLFEISACLAKNWHLPELSQRSFQQTELPSIKQLAALIHKQRANLDTPLMRIINSPVTSIQLANWLSVEASVDWYGKTIKHPFKLIAKHLNISIDKCIGESIRIAVYSARHYTIPGALQPAARLLLTDNSPLQIPEQISLLNSKDEPNKKNKVKIEQQQSLKQANQKSNDNNPINNKNSTTPETPPEPSNQTKISGHTNEQQQEEKTNKAKQQSIEASTKKTKANKEQKTIDTKSDNNKNRSYIYKMISHQLVNQPHKFADPQSILSCCIKGLNEGLDLQRTILYLPKKNKLKPSLTTGCGGDSVLQQLELDLSKLGLLAVFMDKQTSLWVHQDNIKDISSKLPAEFKSAIDSNNFFLISLFIKQKPFAIIYADKRLSGETLTEADYKSFKLLGKATSKCLELLSSHNSRK